MVSKRKRSSDKKAIKKKRRCAKTASQIVDNK